MANSTYSFSDIKMVIKPSGYEAYTVNGSGIGKIGISYANANTVHDLAADGSVMVSKIKANNGTISLTVQQTSLLHAYLIGLFNYLNQGATNLWAATRIDISSLLNIADTHALQGVSFEKRGDIPYEQQGQNITWNFMFAEGSMFGPAVPNLSVSGQVVT